MGLETRSLSELRGIAQNLFGKVDWGWDKAELIRRITNKTEVLIAKPQVSAPPADVRLRTKPLAKNLPSAQVWKELEQFRLDGLIVTFPTPEIVHMRYGQREDSANLRAELRVLMECAKKVLYG